MTYLVILLPSAPADTVSAGLREQGYACQSLGAFTADERDETILLVEAGEGKTGAVAALVKPLVPNATIFRLVVESEAK